MKIGFIIGCLSAVIILLLCIDYYFGKRNRQSQAMTQTYPLRASEIDLFIHGEDLFTDLFTEINRAKEHVHILFYIVKNDAISQDFLKLLTKKAAEGVEVLLLLDWLGGKAVSRKLIKEFQQAGGTFSFSHVPKMPFLFYRLQVRNHRKITVIDRTIGYVGGYNVGKEYIDRDARLSPWRDYHLKITGEGVHDLQKEFLIDWDRATGMQLQADPRYFPLLPKGKIAHRIVPSQGMTIEKTYAQLIEDAQVSIFIGSPYFIPSKKILHDLIAASLRGVDVVVLIPMQADHFLVKEAAIPYVRKLLAHGAQVHEYVQGFYHAKVLLIDEKMCAIGTANFDRRSFFLNDEVNCYMYDEKFIQDVTRIIAYDLADAKQLTLKQLHNLTFLQKTKEVCAKVIAPWM